MDLAVTSVTTSIASIGWADMVVVVPYAHANCLTHLPVTQALSFKAAVGPEQRECSGQKPWLPDSTSGSWSAGQGVVTPPGGSPNNGNPTDCQIFTLTPPPTTGRPTVTRAQLNPRMPLWTWTYFLQRPGFYPRLPNRPSLLPNYNYGFQLNRFYLPQGRLITGRYLGGGRFQSGSSSEESTEK
ncbi:hypothetical protein ACRRTK_015005 [Alexandromys fortis]